MKDNMSKSILLVGDSRSLFIKNLKNNLVQTYPNYIVDVYDITLLKLISRPEDMPNNVTKDLSPISIFMKVIRGLKLMKDFYSFSKKYDIVNFHFFVSYYYYLMKIFKFNYSILTIWGSDFNCRTIKTESKLKKAILLADICSCTNISFKNNIIKALKIDSNLIKVVSFGLEPLNFINNNWCKQDIRNKFNLSLDKKVVVIGYNGSIRQNHIRILDAIAECLSVEQMESIQIILPATYGLSIEYEKKLYQYIERLPYEVTLFKQYLSDIDMAKFRLCADIMINLQESDQFSGSMQEYMYAKCIIITGDWLPYGSLSELGVYYRNVSEISKCGIDLSNVLNDFNAEQLKCNKNSAMIWTISSWESNIHKWHELYMGCNEKRIC